jgi:hypothetical protein
VGVQTARGTAGEGSRVKKESIVDPCFILFHLFLSTSLLATITTDKRQTNAQRDRQSRRLTDRQTGKRQAK